MKMLFLFNYYCAFFVYYFFISNFRMISINLAVCRLAGIVSKWPSTHMFLWLLCLFLFLYAVIYWLSFFFQISDIIILLIFPLKSSILSEFVFFSNNNPQNSSFTIILRNLNKEYVITIYCKAIKMAKYGMLSST